MDVKDIATQNEKQKKTRFIGSVGQSFVSGRVSIPVHGVLRVIEGWALGLSGGTCTHRSGG